MSKKLFFATILLSSVIYTAAAAAPPVAPFTTMVAATSANDGYVLANTASLYELPPKVCPRPLFYFDEKKACIERSSWNRSFTGKPKDPITPQRLLDDKFGPGKTIFVGLSPARPDYDNTLVVIFYKVKETKK